MDLKAFLTLLPDEPARDAFAARCDTSIGHLRNVMYGIRPCAPTLAVAVERESDKAVRRWTLRPEDWHRIWPELIGTDSAPTPAEKAGA